MVFQAWCESDFVPEGSAPAPPAPTCPVPIAWDCEAPGAARNRASPEHVVGCPWCRRPLVVCGTPAAEEEDAARPPAAPAPAAAEASKASGATAVAVGAPSAAEGRCAYVCLLYGPRCHAYFLGALVLGWGLARHGGARERVLLHTEDVPAGYVAALAASGWLCHGVAYLSGVSSALFHNWRRSRFVDVFTKLRALELTDYAKVSEQRKRCWQIYALDIHQLKY